MDGSPVEDYYGDEEEAVVSTEAFEAMGFSAMNSMMNSGMFHGGMEMTKPIYDDEEGDGEGEDYYTAGPSTYEWSAEDGEIVTSEPATEDPSDVSAEANVDAAMMRIADMALARLEADYYDTVSRTVSTDAEAFVAAVVAGSTDASATEAAVEGEEEEDERLDDSAAVTRSWVRSVGSSDDAGVGVDFSESHNVVSPMAPEQVHAVREAMLSISIDDSKAPEWLKEIDDAALLEKVKATIPEVPLPK